MNRTATGITMAAIGGIIGPSKLMLFRAADRRESIAQGLPPAVVLVAFAAGGLAGVLFERRLMVGLTALSGALLVLLGTGPNAEIPSGTLYEVLEAPGVGLLRLCESLKPVCDFVEPFFAGRLRHTRIHVGVFVCFTGNRRLEIVFRVADG